MAAPAARRRRCIGRPIGDDGARTQAISMDCSPTSLHLESSGGQSAVCDNDVDVGGSYAKKIRASGGRSLRRQCLHQSRCLSLCALLAVITLVGAVRHAAFVTRIYRGSGFMKPTVRNRDHLLCGALPSFLACRDFVDLQFSPRISNIFHFQSKGRRRAIMPRRSPLRMTRTDAELQSQNPSTAAEDDEEEWRTVLAAFQMYKAAYGDLKVPSRFVVPGMPPWPEPAWKLKLGQRVANIRSMGRYVQNNEARRKVLDDMGFLWRLRSPSPGKQLDGIEFSQVYDALRVYRVEVQPAGSAPNVPSNFVVPDCEPWPESTRGLPLGKILPTVRSRVYLKKHPEAEAQLNSLGLAPDVKTAANDLRYRRVYDALVRYKELYGDLLVPQPFTVPEARDDGADDWPAEVRGLRLGARVNAIRSQGTFVKANPLRREELDGLGFVWEPPPNADGKRRGRKRKAESGADGAASEKGGNDSSSVGPAIVGQEGGAAGGAAGGAVAPSAFAAPASAFDATRDPFFTGDQSSPPQWAFEGEEEEEDFLLEQEKGDRKYAAPKTFNETLEEMAEMAMSVGIMERWTSNKRVVKGARNKFVPWRNDDFGSDFVFEDVVEALILYKELYENFDSIEEEKFVVPEPVEESLRLSPFELAAMNGDGPEDLDDIDGPWSEDEDGEGPDSKFSVVASNDWPEHLAGMKLGQIVSRICEGGLEVKHLPERKARLDEIGFDWGDPKRFIDVPFEKVMCALYTYFMIRGDTFVEPSFVMPDEQPWPTVLAGFELGAAVTRLRELQNFLEAYHPVKMSLLRMVDFSFFPELALPLDPNAIEMNMEHLYVETFGHPLYHISTVPLGLPERMLADGPNGPPEKLSSWYNYEYVRELHERPGALTSVADWMRDIGFYQLAEEHEQKYGQSHYRQLFLLRQKLDHKQISQEVWDQEIERIKDEVMADFEDWRQGDTNTAPIVGGEGDGEFDYTINEDEYYYQTLELASLNSDSSQFERLSIIPNDLIEESVAEFSLGTDESSGD